MTYQSILNVPFDSMHLTPDVAIFCLLSVTEIRLYKDWKYLWQRKFSCSMIRITQ